MTTEALAVPEAPHTLTSAAIEQVLIGGDLSKLSAADRVNYYKRVCDSLGLNYLTKPFEYMTLNNKLTLYAKRDATDQLRSIKHVSVEVLDRTQHGDLYVVRARATMPDGRTDESLGAVMLANLKGEALANAIMKCETKAKRRVTLSICGLGWLDEIEVDSITETAHQAEVVNTPTGEIAAPALGPDQYHVTHVRELKKGDKNGRPWTLFGITVHTGQMFQTFDVGVADAAEDAHQKGYAVEIHAEKATKGDGLKIVSLSPVSELPS